MITKRLTTSLISTSSRVVLSSSTFLALFSTTSVPGAFSTPNWSCISGMVVRSLKDDVQWLHLRTSSDRLSMKFKDESTQPNKQKTTEGFRFCPEMFKKRLKQRLTRKQLWAVHSKFQFSAMIYCWKSALVARRLWRPRIFPFPFKLAKNPINLGCKRKWEQKSAKKR